MADSKQPATTTTSDLDGLGWVGHSIPAVLGVLALVAAFGAWSAGIQITLTVSLLVVGALLPLLSWLSLGRSRAAWSFLIACSVVLGIMTLFGAPKVRSLVGLPLGVALLIPALFGVAVVALAAQDHRYKN